MSQYNLLSKYFSILENKDVNNGYTTLNSRLLIKSPLIFIQSVSFVSPQANGHRSLLRQGKLGESFIIFYWYVGLVVQLPLVTCTVGHCVWEIFSTEKKECRFQYFCRVSWKKMSETFCENISISCAVQNNWRVKNLWIMGSVLDKNKIQKLAFFSNEPCLH
jgi:hypothetical protein